MILNDLDLVRICAELYTDSAPWDIKWGQDGWGMTAALRCIDERDVVVHRGSETTLDWYDDLESELPLEDPDLGMLPVGFSRPLRAFYSATRHLIRPGPIVIGHSLGAARAVEHAGMLTAGGNPPLAVVVWGEPKAGMSKLAKVLASITVRSYRNRKDPVCTVPVTIGLLDWVHGHDIIPLDAAPPADDEWGLLADHHIQLYEQGLAVLPNIPVIDL